MERAGSERFREGERLPARKGCGSTGGLDRIRGGESHIYVTPAEFIWAGGLGEASFLLFSIYPFLPPTPAILQFS